jgi:hypothetical protein
MDFVTPLLGLLVPYLPGLVKSAAEGVVGDGAKKVVFQAVPAGVRAIWEKLSPKVEADAIAQAAAVKVADEPDNAKRLTTLEMALEDLLKELVAKDPDLVADLQKLLAESQQESQASTIVNVDGTDNQALVNVTAKNVVAKVEGGANFH